MIYTKTSRSFTNVQAKRKRTALTVWEVEESSTADETDRATLHPSSSHLWMRVPNVMNNKYSLLHRGEVSDLVDTLIYWLETYNLPTEEKEQDGKVRG